MEHRSVPRCASSRCRGGGAAGRRRRGGGGAVVGRRTEGLPELEMQRVINFQTNLES